MAKKENYGKTAPGKEKDIYSYLLIGVLTWLMLLLVAVNAAYVQTQNPDVSVIAALSQAVSNVTALKFHFAANAKTLSYAGAASAVFCFLALYQYFDTLRHARDPHPNGEAKWETNMKKFSKEFTDLKDPTNNIILTKNVKLSMNTHKTRRNCNVLVVGGSGSGKTRFLIKPNILQANCSFVITDPAGELLKTEGAMLEEMGYKIKVFNLVDMDHSNSYNPFNYIRDDTGVLMMINCLIKNTNNGQKAGDPFWEKSETALLQALVFYLLKKKGVPDDCKNFTSIMALLRAAEIKEDKPDAKSPLDTKFEELKAEDPNSIALTQYQTFKMGAGKTLKSILISCGVRLTTFNLKSIENLTMMDDLDLKSVGDEKTALFVIIPAADDTYNFLVSMMYSQLFETLYYRAENECPYEYYIKNGAKVLGIARKNSRGDSYTKKDAENLLAALKNAKEKKGKQPGSYYIKIKEYNFTKEFANERLLAEYKKDLESAKIVKGGLRLPYHVRFLLDEFANIGQIPDFSKKLATMRKYEISCTIILQSLAQIKTMYEKDWESIIGNCDSFVFLGGQEYSTAEYISKLFGKTTVISRGRSMSNGKGSGNQSYSNVGKELISTDQLTTMPRDECTCVISGLHPFYGKKYDLESHPNFKYSGDAPNGKEFDCKARIRNYGLRNSGGAAVISIPGEEPLLDQTTEKTQPLSDLDSKKIETMTLTADETRLTETTDEKTGNKTFSYNLDDMDL